MAALAIFFDAGMSAAERRAKADHLGALVIRELRERRSALAAILCAGRSVACACPDSPRYRDLMDLRSSMLIGVYAADADILRISRDIYETLLEYHEGCV